MTTLVKDTIKKINSFRNIDELHNYICNELNLDEFTQEEFLTVWHHMNKFDK